MEKKDAAGCVTSVIFRDIRFPTRLEKDGSDSIVSIVIVVFSFVSAPVNAHRILGVFTMLSNCPFLYSITLVHLFTTMI